MKYLALSFLFIISCRPNPDLSGIWTDGSNSFLFRNDSIFGLVLQSKYSLSKGQIITPDLLFSFQLKNQSLILDSDIHGRMELRRAKFDNLFDESTQQIGHIDLPNGYSHHTQNQKNMSPHYVYIKNDGEIYFENQKTTISQLESKIVPSRQLSIILAIDKNLPIAQYQDVYQSISLNDSLTSHIYHTTRDLSPFCPKSMQWEYWNNTSTLKTKMIYTNYFHDSVYHDFILINLGIKDNQMTIDHKIQDSIAIFDELTTLYVQNPDKTIFIIQITKEFTYGHFISFYSLVDKIINSKRNQYAQNKYGKNMDELRYSTEKNMEGLDSIYKLFPTIILVNDPYKKHVNPLYPHSYID